MCCRGEVVLSVCNRIRWERFSLPVASRQEAKIKLDFLGRKFALASNVQCRIPAGNEQTERRSRYNRIGI